MMKFKSAVLMMVLVGCSSAQCRKPMEIKKDTEGGVPEKLLAGPGRALVAKKDGSKQCEKADQSSAKSVEAMKSELKDIKVYDMAKQQDGVMRIALCGSPTGDYNVYEIGEEDVKKASGFGFVRWPILKKGAPGDDR